MYVCMCVCVYVCMIWQGVFPQKSNEFGNLLSLVILVIHGDQFGSTKDSRDQKGTIGNICMYACMHACKHKCMCVCLYVCTYVRTYHT